MDAIPTAVVVIPARLRSTRLDRKVLVDIAGKPMLRHVCELASRTRLPKAVLVATDSEEVADAVSSWGFKPYLTDPELPSGTARVAAIVDLVEEDLIINVQGDEPLIEPALVDEVIEALGETGSDIVTPVYPLDAPELVSNPYEVKVVRTHDGRALYFSRSAIPHVRDVAIEDWLQSADYWGHAGVYGFRREVLVDYGSLSESPLENVEKLEQLRFLQAGYHIHTIETPSRPVTVDTEQDLENVRKIMGGE